MTGVEAVALTPDVSILIVCYQSLDLIGDCLAGVFQHTSGCRFEVLLVDCSADGTVQYVEQNYPQVRVIPTSENLGFGAGNNFLAAAAQGKYLLLLNPDTIVTDNSIGELYRIAEARPDAGAVGGRCRLRDGSLDPGCRQSVPTLFRLTVSALGGMKYLNGALAETAREPGEVETLSGAFMLVRNDAWRQLHGFDTSFFMYSEELDLCVRLKQNGWKIVMTPKAEIIHLVGSGNSHSARRITLLTTGRMHFLRKFWSRPRMWIGGMILWLHGVFRILLATCGSPIIGRERARTLRDAYRGIVLHPGSWWHGFDQHWQARN